jgi:hypothetical protein
VQEAGKLAGGPADNNEDWPPLQHAMIRPSFIPPARPARLS